MKAIERLYKFLEYKGIKPAAFERGAGISNGYLSKQHNRNADIGESILILIMDYCPEMSPEWLLTGKGEMLRSDPPGIKESPAGLLEEFRQENEELKKENRRQAKMIDTLIETNKALVEQLGAQGKSEREQWQKDPGSVTRRL